MRKMLTPTQYEERKREYLARAGANPGSGVLSKMGWHQQVIRQFHEELKAENLGFEANVSDEYVKLRDTSAVQHFLSCGRSQMSSGEFVALAHDAMLEAFGALEHLDQGWPKLKDGAVARRKAILQEVMSQRGIVITDHGE